MATYQELQGKNVRSSLLLIGVISSTTLVAGYIAGLYFFPGNIYGPWIGLGIAGVIAGIQGMVAWFAGADLVLKISRAREIDADNGEFRQVYNLCEEMKIAAGLPMPRVYVIHDPAPNAFATGRNPEDGRVAVTTGLIERLSREELQGVIAHEMAHIKNRDILFATVVGIMVGMIAIICDIMLRSFFWNAMLGGRRGGDRGGGQAQGVIMIIGIAFAILAPLFAVLVQMAVSRQREYLADATGAHFTRNPGALAGALVKISSSPDKLRGANHGTAHMWISNPYKQQARAEASSVFSTHPPISKRIERLSQIGAAMTP